MIRSMTGIGKVQQEVKGVTVTAEARSLNHRFLEISVKVPEVFSGIEEKIKKMIKKYVKRGTVQVHVHISNEVKKKVVVDKEKAYEYIKIFTTLKKRLGLSGDIDLQTLVSLPGIIKEEEETPFFKKSDLMEVVRKAVLKMVEMREKEGKALERDIKKGIQNILKLLSKIEKRAPLVTQKRMNKIRKNLEEILSEYDKNRLFEELLYLAEKYDIHEECIRLKNHCNLFLKTIKGKSPNGRRLIFIAQEMLKEANTIGAKSQDSLLSQNVVKIKEEIEKLKEQLQNIE